MVEMKKNRPWLARWRLDGHAQIDAFWRNFFIKNRFFIKNGRLRYSKCIWNRFLSRNSKKIVRSSPLVIEYSITPNWMKSVTQMLLGMYSVAAWNNFLFRFCCFRFWNDIQWMVKHCVPWFSHIKEPYKNNEKRHLSVIKFIAISIVKIVNMIRVPFNLSVNFKIVRIFFDVEKMYATLLLFFCWCSCHCTKIQLKILIVEMHLVEWVCNCNACSDGFVKHMDGVIENAIHRIFDSTKRLKKITHHKF